MNFEALLIFATPVVFAAVVFGMYKFGVGGTNWDGYPSPPQQPYREPSARKQLQVIAGLTLLLYLFLLFSAGPFVAAVALAALLALQGICVLIFTAIQEVVYWVKGPKLHPETGAVIRRRPFARRLLWNYFHSYEAIGHLIP